MDTFGKKGISIRENVFLDDKGSFSLDVKQVAKSGLEDLLSYRVISKNDLERKYYYKVCDLEFKVNICDILQPLSPEISRQLRDGFIPEDEVKDILGDVLMEQVYHSVVFGNPSKKIEGIATLPGRSKLSGTSASSLTMGTMLHQKVIEAKRKSEEYKEEFDGFYQLLLPYKFEHLLLELYHEPKYITVKDALLKDHNIITVVCKELDHPILYEPDATVMFMPILSEVNFRKFSALEGDYIYASILAGIVHFCPKEVVEITISAS
ncbi:Hypothetical protein BCD_0856 (plasmid) [Borrelia crocidurae DOU]|uniref:Uncharacterized protein n=1 Tax=Borrelia crocidurae DOU TaxID=1293575 RepID=W5SJ25_9SPIR|nr:hypothetical protein [Borrelia crocidurae]AHH06922.1 Hypothetical protein BCD_0856 [Borrelia crocidurae DOU]